MFEVEYRLTRDEFCPDAETLGFNAIKKSRNYSLFAHAVPPVSLSTETRPHMIAV